MNGITNLRGMNKKHEETNYCTFDDNRKMKATKDCIYICARNGLNLFYSLYVRWWLTNIKCQASYLVTDSSDQKLGIVPSLTKFRVSETFIDIVCCWFISLIVEKNCYLPTLKLKLEREISCWQTHKLIILLISGRTAKLQLKIYPETGWGVMNCYSYHTEI